MFVMNGTNYSKDVLDWTLVQSTVVGKLRSVRTEKVKTF